MVRKALLIGGAALLMSAVVMLYYFSTGEPQVLVLDKTVFREVLEELPGSEKEAIAMSMEAVLGYYNVSKEEFGRYFTLANATMTRYRWIVVYEVEENPNVLVYLVKKITPEEGFGIADRYIVERVGEEYFKEHYQRKAFDGNTARYTFTITGSAIYKIGMWLRLDDERKVAKRHVLLEPQEVKVKSEEATKIAAAKGVPEPMKVALIFDGRRLAWRVTWEHKPREEDYKAKRIYGADVDAEKGSVLRVHRYVKPAKPSPSKISKAQVDALAQKTKEFMELADGAVINVRISKSYSEEYTIIKSLGRLVVKEGLSNDSDITIWIDRDAFEKALKSDDPMTYLTQESKKGKVSITEDKNPVALARKGYVKLYDKFKGK
jgi:hypothetical protein